MPFMVGMAIAYFFDPVARQARKMGFLSDHGDVGHLDWVFHRPGRVGVIVDPDFTETDLQCLTIGATCDRWLREFIDPLLAQVSTEIDQDTVTSIKSGIQKYAGTVAQVGFWICRQCLERWSRYSEHSVVALDYAARRVLPAA